ncbi:serine protease [Thalassotalea psychrophila]|uniref:Serine protease n=1 Tax=Thalassotalea psychrophila TaxID=3065647 RepID=A0ABY9TV67_9GAMM|nr:serine protease [Colwelliaceae bacterium SQ149]
MKRLVVLVFSLYSIVINATEQAQQIFQDMAPSLYQIRLIDKATSEKSSIGSGFQISENGYIATNYHVISGYAQYPEKYVIEYEDHLGNKGHLDLQTVDVINDLAIVLLDDNPQTKHFNISEKTPSKGEELYSLGNPHDLGMIVVPGTYNGLKKEAFNDRIHFTGSVNPGMSGGPVVNKFGQVVGINVASSGNQIGFLIPHDKLANLINNFDVQIEQSIDEQITAQLKANQTRLLNEVMLNEWQTKTFANASIPNTGVNYIRCWGNSNADKPDELLFKAVTNCQMEEYVYISESFTTGSINMEFHFFNAEELSSTRFYQIYQTQINRAGPGNRAGKEDVTEYECQHDITTDNEESIRNKAILCIRAYKKYRGLYDVMYLSATVDQDAKALVSHFTLSGVDKNFAQVFNKKFMESVKWN